MMPVLTSNNAIIKQRFVKNRRLLLYYLRSWYFISIFMKIIMRTAKLLLLFVLLSYMVKAQQPAALPTDELYEYLVMKHNSGAAPDGYGLNPGAPITVGIYEVTMADEAKMKKMLDQFLKTYLWADGSQIIFISRKSAMINNVNYDLFRVTKGGTKDTLTLYIDMYKQAPVFVPKGFKFYTKENMAAELSPVLTSLKKYNLIADKYADTTAKRMSFQLINYLQSNIGLDYLMDTANLAPLLNDTGIDLDLRAYLIRSYVFHKMEYELTGHADPLKNAFNAVVDDYQDVIKKHEIFSKGSLNTTLVKK